MIVAWTIVLIKIAITVAVDKYIGFFFMIMMKNTCPHQGRVIYLKIYRPGYRVTEKPKRIFTYSRDKGWRSNMELMNKASEFKKR